MRAEAQKVFFAFFFTSGQLPAAKGQKSPKNRKEKEMAIDTSKIEGYDEMSTEEKLAAVLALKEEEENDAVKKANKEAKDRKLELRTEKEKNEGLQKQVNELLRQNAISKMARTFSKKLGINLEDAEALAENLSGEEPDIDAVCDFVIKHTESAVKNAKKDIYGSEDGGSTGKGTNDQGKDMTKEKLLKMSIPELEGELAKHPEYEKLLY